MQKLIMDGAATTPSTHRSDHPPNWTNLGDEAATAELADILPIGMRTAG
jgi:hypothetical protein